MILRILWDTRLKLRIQAITFWFRYKKSYFAFLIKIWSDWIKQKKRCCDFLDTVSRPEIFQFSIGFQAKKVMDVNVPKRVEITFFFTLKNWPKQDVITHFLLWRTGQNWMLLHIFYFEELAKTGCYYTFFTLKNWPKRDVITHFLLWRIGQNRML